MGRACRSLAGPHASLLPGGSYSLGLRNVAVPYQAPNLPSAHYNQAFQVALSYLAGGKN